VSETRTPAEIRAWFEANAGTLAASLAAERAVRAILGLHDGARTAVNGDLLGCRTTRAINAEINHVLAGDAIVTGSGGSSQDTPPAPRPGGRTRDAMIHDVLASHSTGRRRPAVPMSNKGKPYRYLIAKNASDEGIYLVWSGTGSNTDLTEETYEQIAAEAHAAGLAADTYHVYSRRCLLVTDDVAWYPLPRGDDDVTSFVPSETDGDPR
jgi:hypothetical protein